MSQQEQVTRRLRQDWTTQLDALRDCGCMRLSARVQEMRLAGLTVIDKWVEHNGKRYKAYRIIE